MKMNNRIIMLGFVALCGAVQAGFVTIGNAGNAADTYGYGDVAYTYQISDREISIAQMAASGAGSGDENYWSAQGVNAPAVRVSFHEAAKYCNWLTSGNVNNGAYQLNGSGEVTNINRAAAISFYGEVFALPTINEWYKASYFKNGVYSRFATGSSTAPTAGLSGENYDEALGYAWAGGSGVMEQNGTYDMGGNVWEWSEGTDGPNQVFVGGTYELSSSEMKSGVAWKNSNVATTSVTDIGFRVVAIPEPATVLLFGIGGIGAWLLRRNKLKSKEENDD